MNLYAIISLSGFTLNKFLILSKPFGYLPLRALFLFYRLNPLLISGGLIVFH